MEFPCPLPWPTPPFPLFPPLFPPPFPEVGEGVGVGVGEDVGVPFEETPAVQAVVLFWMDFPEQSKFEDVVLPRNDTERTITAAIPTTITEYSTAVAPRSFRRIFLRRLNMPVLSGQGPAARMRRRDQRCSPVLRRAD